MLAYRGVPCDKPSHVRVKFVRRVCRTDRRRRRKLHRRALSQLYVRGDVR